MSTHFVYRAYDADGVMLYVGLTKQPDKRYREHLCGNYDGRGWFQHFVTKWVVTGPLSRAAAEALELAEIDAHNPIFNGQAKGNCTPKLGTRQLVKDYFRFHGLTYPVVAA